MCLFCMKLSVFTKMYPLVYILHGRAEHCALLYRDAGISAVAFHPTHKVAVSSSYGGDFKVILVEWQYKS